MGLRERLLQAIELRGTTAYAVEMRAGLGRGHLSRLLAGTRPDMTTRTLLAVADALDVSCEWLLRGVGPIERSAIPSWDARPKPPAPSST